MVRTNRPRRRFAQHFLAASWARKVVDAIAPRPGDVFVEIGPGTGAITLPLAERGLPILAVELDRDLTAALASRVPSNVTMVSGDFLQTDIVALVKGLAPQVPAGATEWPGLKTRPSMGGPSGDGPGLRPGPPPRYRLVGNLPYNITTPILERLIDIQRRTSFFEDATIMVQREVADRLAARAGTKAYGALSVMVQRRASVARVLDLPPGAFNPPPKVRSSVVRLHFDVSAPALDEAAFERLVKALFSQRRKTLANALRRAHPGGPAALAQSGFDPRRRPETLQVPEITRLATLIASPEPPPVI